MAERVAKWQIMPYEERMLLAGRLRGWYRRHALLFASDVAPDAKAGFAAEREGDSLNIPLCASTWWSIPTIASLLVWAVSLARREFGDPLDHWQAWRDRRRLR